MPTFFDQLNREITLADKAELKIVSVVPSQTEFLFDIGLAYQIVGITKFCIHPKKYFKSTTKIGGTKTLDLQKIREIKPDIIIANKEENEKSQIEELEKEFPVYISDIYTLDDSYEMMLSLGEIFNKSDEAIQLVNQIRESFKNLKQFNNRRVAYFIWREPWMLASKSTFIDHILEISGHANVAKELNSDARYPATELSALKTLEPFDIYLSSEPYPFKEKHIAELQAEFPLSKIQLVDGEMYSWYGSRLKHTAGYLVTVTSDL